MKNKLTTAICVASAFVLHAPLQAQPVFEFENLAILGGEGGAEIANGSIEVDPENPLNFTMTGSDGGSLEIVPLAGPPGSDEDAPPLDFQVVPLSSFPAFETFDAVSIYFTVAETNGFVSGDFSYLTFDEDGGFDPAGYFVNSNLTQLSDDSLTTFDGEGPIQFGSFSFNVMTGDTWGFYINATDNCCGASEFSVNATFEPGVVPEPASWAMLIAGFGLVGASMRRRRSALAHG